MFCELRFITQVLFLAALSELLAVGFFRLRVLLPLLFGGAHFGLYPHFAARFHFRTLTGADDDELLIDRLFNGDEGEHPCIDEAGDHFEAEEEEDEDGRNGLGLHNRNGIAAVCQLFQ